MDTNTRASIWDERYGSVEYVYGTEANDFLKRYAPLPQEKYRSLELGCGEGRNAVYLAQLGYQVDAVDLSSKGLEKTQSLAQQRGVVVHTEQHDLGEFSIPDQRYHLIIAIFAHLPSPVRTALFSTVLERLLPGGCFLFELYRPLQLKYDSGGPKDPDLLSSLAEMNSYFAEGQWLLRGETIRQIAEGNLHQGPSATVQGLVHKLGPQGPARILLSESGLGLHLQYKR